ncbi:MAG: hypothetical protein CMK70_13625 [Pseudohongiella sp.]|nr:hypothetical protein [Pseudohongiella sp.]|tara:strand:+ start:1376 stop:1816 length:441 start_codon:yes stop_codon:yes gene_type:complete
MLHSEFWLQIEYWPLSQHIGATWWFPLLNSLHVVSMALMLGGLLMLDLRLLGLTARNYTVKALGQDFLPWVWSAFIVAVITGLGLFITRASAHVLNPAFQWKVGLMLCAGINMVLVGRLPPRWSGALSLLLWAGVVLAGRWMGHII